MQVATPEVLSYNVFLPSVTAAEVPCNTLDREYNKIITFLQYHA